MPTGVGHKKSVSGWNDYVIIIIIIIKPICNAPDASLNDPDRS